MLIFLKLEHVFYDFRKIETTVILAHFWVLREDPLWETPKTNLVVPKTRLERACLFGNTFALVFFHVFGSSKTGVVFPPSDLSGTWV